MRCSLPARKSAVRFLCWLDAIAPCRSSVYADSAMPASLGTGQVVASASLNGLLGAGEQLTVSTAGLPDRDFDTRFPTRRYLSATALVPLGTIKSGGARDGAFIAENTYEMVRWWRLIKTPRRWKKLLSRTISGAIAGAWQLIKPLHLQDVESGSLPEWPE